MMDDFHQMTSNRCENGHQMNLEKPNHQMTKVVVVIVIGGW